MAISWALGNILNYIPESKSEGFQARRLKKLCFGEVPEQFLYFFFALQSWKRSAVAVSTGPCSNLEGE